MIEKGKNLCVFIHFSELQVFPKYVEVFVEELSQYFDELILVTNKRKISSEANVQFSNVRLLYVQNEGYDLGMFYKAVKTINLADYSQIGCINDSNVLFKQMKPVFEWSQNQDFDMWGLVDSYEKPLFSSHSNNYHIQSHFLVFNRKAIGLLPLYFQLIQPENLFHEKDKEKLRESVIDHWEIGLSQFLINKGLKIGSYFDIKSFSKKRKINITDNLSYRHYYRLIEEGYPLIKKKIVTKKPSLKLIAFPNRKWDTLLLNHGSKNFPINEILNDFKKQKKSKRTVFKKKIKFLQSWIRNSFFP